MTVSAWLATAKKLHKACINALSEGKGSKDITMPQATILNQLQHAIGSNHGIHLVTYSQARVSLDTMFDMVNAGQKTPPLTQG